MTKTRLAASFPPEPLNTWYLVPGIECRKSELLGTKYLPYLESRYQVQSSKSNFVLYSKVVLDFFIYFFSETVYRLTLFLGVRCARPAICLIQNPVATTQPCPRSARMGCETRSGAASTEQMTRCTAETWVTRWWRRSTLWSE